MVTEVQSEEFIKKDDVLGNCKSYHIKKSKCNFPDCESQINNFCNEQMELIRNKDIPGIKKSQRKFKKKLKKMNLDHYFIKDFETFGDGDHCKWHGCDWGHIGDHTRRAAEEAARAAAREARRVAEAAAKEAKRVAEAAKRALEKAAKNFVDRFDVAGSIKIDPQALLNKLNLDREFKKMIKNIGIEDLIDSLKQPLEGVKNEINKIPQSFEKIANEIGDMGKNLPKLLRLDKVGDGILKLLKQMFGTLMDAVSPFFKWIINVVIFMLKPFARIFLWLYKKLKVKTVFGSIYALMFMMIFLGLMSDIWSIYSILMRVVNNILPVMKI